MPLESSYLIIINLNLLMNYLSSEDFDNYLFPIILRSIDC